MMRMVIHRNYSLKKSKASRVAMAASVMLTVASCAPVDRRDFTGLSTTEADGRFGEAVFVARGGCPQAENLAISDEEAAGIAVSLLPVVASLGASFLTSYIEKRLEEAEKGLAGQFIASGVFGPGQPTDGDCIIVVRGIFDDRFTGDAGDFDQSKLLEFGLADYPAFYLEMKARRPVNTNSLVFEPQYLAYGASSARRSGSGQKQVAVVLVASQQALTTEEEVTGDTPFAIFRHNLGRLQIGRRYKSGQLGVGTAATQPRDEAFDGGPFNVSVLVTESERPSVALGALAAAYTDNQDDLEAALTRIISDALGVENEDEG